MSQAWVEKYVPKTTDQIVGQEEAIKKVSAFIDNYKQQKKKALLLYGPPGCGKTSLAYALSAQKNLELIELNASDFRKPEQIENILGAASKQMSLFAKGKVILVDEIDGISGTKDRGGIPALIKMIKGSAFPVICIANDAYNDKLKTLRKEAELIEMHPIGISQGSKVLEEIARKEQIAFDSTQLQSIMRRSGGDLRAAINDLQISAALGSLERKDMDALSDREHEESLPQALVRVFKTTDPQVALGAFDNVTEDHNEIMLWIDHNLPQEYTKPEDLARAYDYLSRADIMNRRIRRWQHWRFLVYIYAYLSAGIAVSKEEKYRTFTKYKPTMRLLRIWQVNMKNAKRKSIAQKLAEHTHCSSKEAFEHVAYFKAAGNTKLIDQLTQELELDDGEVAWLRKER
ncbi:replication factor C large subunit [Candidatus Woesearchaeota archaeon]|nr:MAG: replication factor C large subunit [Candidatus Woesearchaeota archaeon]